MEKNEFARLIADLEQKAQSGDSLAMKHLGDAYFQGPSGEEENYSAALPYWKQAVDHGELSVAFAVAQAFYSGKGCEKDEATALHYFLICAENDNIDSQFIVGLFYEKGIGCASDEAKAMKFYEKAALHGHGEAQYHLGMLKFANKETVGLHWLCCAHLSGVREATELLRDLGCSSSLLESFIRSIQQNGVDPGKSPGSGSSGSDSGSGGCYVATCVYGSYDCAPVWTLRRFRDETLAKTWYGRLFIHVYYTISPAFVRWFGNTVWFKRICRRKLDRFVSRLQSEGVESSPYTDKRW